MTNALRRPWVLIPLLLVALFGLYLAAGLWLVPKLVKDGARDYVATKLKNKAVTLGDVRFNPLKLALDIDTIAITDTRLPAETMVGVRHVQVNVSTASIWKLSPQLDSVLLDGPLVNAVLRKDGTLNLVELVPPDDGKPVPEVFIGHLAVSSGSASFTDKRAATPLQKQLTPISFKLDNFATRTDAGGGFNFDAASDDGREKFHWDGNLSMAPLASKGRFRIDGLKLTGLYKFVADSLPVLINGGVLELAGSYDFAALPKVPGKPVTTRFDATLAQLSLSDLALRTRDGDDVSLARLTLALTQVSLGSNSATIGAVALTGLSARRAGGEAAQLAALTLSPTTVVLSAQTADVGTLTLDALSVTGRGSGAETIKLGKISVGPSRIDAKAQIAKIGVVSMSGLRLKARLNADNSISVTGLYPVLVPKAGTKAAPATGKPWRVALAGLSTDDGAVSLTLAKAKPVKQIDIAPIKIDVGELDDALDHPVALKVSTRINKTAALALNGTVNPATSTAAIAVDVSNLQVGEFKALLPLPPTVVLQSALVGAKGKLNVANGRKGPQFGYDGYASVANFKLNERNGDPLVDWKQLKIDGVRFSSAPERLTIARLSFDRPHSQVTITTDEQINLMRASGRAPAAPPPTTAVGKVRVKAVMSKTLAEAGDLLPIDIATIAFNDGKIGFSDYSIKPSFGVSINGFAGTITGVSTRPGSQAKFNLKGYVIDRFAPVSITGHANLFAYDQSTDITASFKNIELPVFNPYSGEYAGYNIAKGKLSTTLHYKIDHRALDAQHHVVIDQLEWGDATANKPKVSLPVRMATSLLKDKNGVIDLDLPVAGTLDDPTFKIWPVVWKVVGNLFGKIAAAPFKLIGAMFGGGDDAQFVSFDPGSAVLAADSSKSLGALAKGLAEHPAVNLDIPAGAGIREDSDAMAMTSMHNAALGKKGGDYAALDAGARADKLKGVYKAKFGKNPDFPKDLPTANLISSKDTKHAAAEAEVKWLEAALLPKFAPSDADLAALGQARADTVKQALLADGSIEPTRVFIATGSSVKAKDSKVQMELAVK